MSNSTKERRGQLCGCGGDFSNEKDVFLDANDPLDYFDSESKLVVTLKKADGSISWSKHLKPGPIVGITSTLLGFDIFDMNASDPNDVEIKLVATSPIPFRDPDITLSVKGYLLPAWYIGNASMDCGSIEPTLNTAILARLSNTVLPVTFAGNLLGYNSSTNSTTLSWTVSQEKNNSHSSKLSILF